MSNEEIIRAFHLMWDNFPEAVMITQKSREIIAVNKKAAEFGLAPGIKCSSIGNPENHKGCQCNAACDTGEAQFVTYEGNFGKAFGYWIPIPDKPEWIIHFGVGYAFEYKKISRGKAAKTMESLHSLTKGTELEPMMAAMAQGEANGVMMYYALARLAKEQGLDEVAPSLSRRIKRRCTRASMRHLTAEFLKTSGNSSRASLRLSTKARQALSHWLIKFVRRASTRRLMKWKSSPSRKVITELLSTN